MSDFAAIEYAPLDVLKAVAQGIWIVDGPAIRFGVGGHYSWLAEWKAAFPAADVYLAPGVRDQVRKQMDFPCLELAASDRYPWDGEVRTCAIESRFFTEVDFFHLASRTLVLTDLIENFEARKLATWPMQLIARFGGVLDPHGSMPKDMRLSFRKQRRELRAAVETMISWGPERIIIAHGRWYQQDGVKELERAFRWLLS